MDFSVCILVDKWHDRLPDFIASFHAAADEILLGVNGGFLWKDPVQLTSLPKLKIIPLPWKGYGTTKNNLAALAKNDWIFSVDSDEMADRDLQQSLAQIITPDIQTVLAVQRLNFLNTRPIFHGSWGKKKGYIRIYNRKFTAWNKDPVHETILEMSGMKILRLKGMLQHFTAANIGEVRAKSRRYATLAFENQHQNGKQIALWKKWASPAFTFCKEYIFQLGFLDGKAGFQIARNNAQYTYWKYSGT
jgi:hypothetical protein